MTAPLADIGNPALPALSRREWEVLRLVAQGLGDAEIGARLFLSPNTVKTHVRHLIVKLGARDRTSAVACAFEAGLLTTRAVGLLKSARPLLRAIPPCPWHESLGPGSGRCPECRRWLEAQRLAVEADALSAASRRPGGAP